MRFPNLPISGNDGMEIRPLSNEMVTFSSLRPNFEKFKKALGDYVQEMEDVGMNDMGYIIGC
jgi:hypothetical protein